MFVSFCETPRGAASRGHDAPYGMLVPQRVDGLLVTGRGAGWARRGHDPAFRSRTQMMRFGQAAGVAAALSARQGAPPRGLDVKELQRRLLAEGFYLGDEARLNELGLAAPSRDAGGESLAGAVCAAGDPLPQTQREDALCP